MFTRILLVLLLSTVSVSSYAIDAAEVAKAPDEICPILVGSPLPDISLQDLAGKSFDLNKAVLSKPTVLIYFRGGW